MVARARPLARMDSSRTEKLRRENWAESLLQRIDTSSQPKHEASFPKGASLVRRGGGFVVCDFAPNGKSREVGAAEAGSVVVEAENSQLA